MNMLLLAAAVVLGAVLMASIVIATLATAAIHLAGRGVRLTPLGATAHDANYGAVEAHLRWAQEHGFAFAGSYRADAGAARMDVAAWRHRDEPTWFSVYLAGDRRIYDLTTVFSETRMLTTTDSPDAGFLPRPPGDYQQVFADASLEELYDAHEAARDFLTQRGGIECEPPDWSLEQCFTEQTVRIVSYVRSLPFWRLRTLVWYAVRRQRLRNLTVMEQHRRGMVRLPWEPGFSEFEPDTD